VSPAAVEPPSTRSGGRGRRGGGAILAGALVACLAAAAPAAEVSQPPAPIADRSPSLPLPPAVGAPAPDIPLFDGDGKESSLREVLKQKIIVLVFYIGYT